MAENAVFVLFLEGTLITPLMARNALKSNVTWSSYPFLPPTGASGCLAELVTEARWHEGNALGLEARRLHETPGYERVFALGAYPSEWQTSRRHFRAHLGKIFNYEAVVWAAGRNEGKKLAVVEETLADALRFVVACEAREPLARLHEKVRGRLTPVAKKGSLQFAFRPQADIIELKPGSATGEEMALTLTVVSEMGSLPRRPLLPGQPLLHYVPWRSRSRGSQMEWDVVPCVWEEGLTLRAGVPIYGGEHTGTMVGLSCQIWDRIRGPWG